MSNGDESLVEPEFGPGPANGLDRRRLLAQAAAAGTIIWAAPSILRVAPAQAVGSVPKTVTTDLYKWSSNPPSSANVCTAGPAGSADRGEVVFTVNCQLDPVTISATITVVSGPSLDGANARNVTILQSNSAATCLTPGYPWTSPAVPPITGTFNAPNGTAVVIGPTPVLAGATYFSVVMLQTGGGGTDTYSTTRVNIDCSV